MVLIKTMHNGLSKVYKSDNPVSPEEQKRNIERLLSRDGWRAKAIFLPKEKQERLMH